MKGEEGGDGHDSPMMQSDPGLCQQPSLGPPNPAQPCFSPLALPHVYRWTIVPVCNWRWPSSGLGSGFGSGLGWRGGFGSGITTLDKKACEGRA